MRFAPIVSGHPFHDRALAPGGPPEALRILSEEGYSNASSPGIALRRTRLPARSEGISAKSGRTDAPSGGLPRGLRGVNVRVPGTQRGFERAPDGLGYIHAA